MMKAGNFRLRSFVVLILFAASMQHGEAADDFEAFKRQQMQGVQQIKQEFQEYKEKQDKEFADFLKSQWSEFDTYRGKERIKEPKPKKVPIVVLPPPPPPPKPVPGIKPPPAPVTPPQVVYAPVIPTVLPPPPPQPKPIPLAADMLEIEFFGNMVRFHFDQKWKDYRLTSGAKPEVMSAFWTMMSGTSYDVTVKEISDNRSSLKMDDWAGVTLWRSVAQTLQPGRRSEQNLLLWYFLTKSGYDVRLGYAGADVHLFVAMKQPVYSTKFTKVGDQVYYAVLAPDHGDSIRSFYTYDASYPEKLRPMDVQTAATGFTKSVSASRTLSFEYKGKQIKFTVPYDRRLVEYFDTFPQSDFDLYFDTDGSSLLKRNLLPDLQKYMSNMNTEEKVEFLLAFVQKAFAYKTDNDQFGRERYFFVEESMYFPYNDCEDRAIMFTWLVRELVGLKTVGLLYPGHMSSAVALPNPKPDYATVGYKGVQYVIADPTYIGAPVGLPMPSYAKLKPTKIVDIH